MTEHTNGTSNPLTETQRTLLTGSLMERQRAISEATNRLNAVMTMIAREHGYDDPRTAEFVPDENGMPTHIRERQAKAEPVAAGNQEGKPKAKTKKRKSGKKTPW
jgi:hypothetical protein